MSPDDMIVIIENLAKRIRALEVRELPVSRVLINEQTPSVTGTVTFSGIPSIYKHLIIEYIARSTLAASTYDGAYCYLNNDTTNANYRMMMHYAYAAGTPEAYGDNAPYCDELPAANSPVGSCSQGKLCILFYTGTTFNKQITILSNGRHDNASQYEMVYNTGIEWENTAAVNRIDLVLDAGNYVAGSTFILYGVM